MKLGAGDEKSVARRFGVEVEIGAGRPHSERRFDLEGTAFEEKPSQDRRDFCALFQCRPERR
jgi:hypothetical protein